MTATRMLDGFRVADVDPDYRRDPKTQTYCIRCQRDLKPGQERRFIRAIAEGWAALHPEDEYRFDLAAPVAGDLGRQPVGMDCARVIGLDYTFKTEGPWP